MVCYVEIPDSHFFEQRVRRRIRKYSAPRFGVISKLDCTMSEKKPKITCAYCGGKFERSKLTRDHVVPSCLFEPLKPTKPITVLACGVCNNNEKFRNDAFLRDMVAADPVVAVEPDIDHLWNAFRRSAQKGHSEFYKMMVKGDDPRAASLLLPHLQQNSIKLRLRKKGSREGCTTTSTRMCFPINIAMASGVFRKPKRRKKRNLSPALG